MSTTDCDQLGALHVSDNLNKDRTDNIPPSDVNEGREVLLTVPPTFTQFPLGFALDAGGSVVKLVYRSKLDYTTGQPNKGDHILRLRFFPNGNSDDLIQFLKDNCDVRVTSNGDASSGDLPLFYQTGVNLQHFVKKLESAFHCRIKMLSEMDAGIDGLLRVTNIIPQLKQNVPFYVESVNAALQQFREILQVYQQFKEAGIEAYGKPPTIPSDFDLPGYIMRMMMAEPSTLAGELTSTQVAYPCVYMQCGSATVANILYENGEYESGDFNQTAGKTVLALGRLLAGAQNFMELMMLAERGDHRKVDIFTGDLKNADHVDPDWYSLMPESFPVFTLGRLADKRFDGTYTKEDVAAALIHMQCAELCRFGINTARIHHVTSVLFAGSFCDWPMSHRLLQEYFLKGASNLRLRGEAAMTMHIFPSCGFMPALGTWHENVKQHS